MNIKMTPVSVLLVEDNPGDVRLTQEAFRSGRLAVDLRTVRDGTDALKFLSREAPYEDAPCPDLILLDLNLPNMDGREVLARLKENNETKHIPVVVLTTSEADRDVISAYQLHANCYIQKPVDYNRFIDIVKSIEDFWLTVVKLPSDSHIW